MILIDLGNTRIKWAQVYAGDMRHGLPQPTLADLFMAWQGMDAPQRVLACSVRSAAENQQLADWVQQAWHIQIEWLHAQERTLGVLNHYHAPQRLGADRWAAILGARALYGRAAMVLVSAGTALVVDAVDANDGFLGGMILPGYRLMKSALAGQTAQLPLAEGEFAAFPQCTVDAIETGCISAMVGAVQSMYQRLSAHAGIAPIMVLTGGDASLIAPHLAYAVMLRDDLALQGLLAFALQGDNTEKHR